MTKIDISKDLSINTICHEDKDSVKLLTALLTPYDKEGNIDFESMHKIMEKQSSFADGLVIMGTTQEYTLLTKTERTELLKFTLNEMPKNLTRIVGIGEMDSASTVKNAIFAQQCGAEKLLVVTPYYSKCTKDGLVAHYNAISEATHLPIVIYNVPQRTGYDLDCEILKRLLEIKNIVGIKQCSTNYSTSKFIAENYPHIKLYYGNDSDYINFRAIKNAGLVSVLSNALPQFTKKAITGDSTCLMLMTKLSAICAKEVSPVAVKYLAYKLQLIKTPTMRLPLTPLNIECRKEIDNFLQKYSEVLL